MDRHDFTIAGIDIEHYFRLLIRQKWFVLVPAIVGVGVMVFLSLSMKNQYSAKATILVEPQSLPSQFMSSALPYGPETYVRSLVEQIKSRSRLEEVIKQYKLYPNMVATRPMEEVVGLMREKIEIERRGQDTFSVSFTGDSPVVVQQVTNTLTDLFIEENIKFRLARSAQNVAFLEQMAAKFRADVSAQEKRIQEFKGANLDSLPEQRMATQSQLNAAQQRLDAIGDAMSAARARLKTAEDMVALASKGRVSSGRTESEERAALRKEYAAASKELADLSARLSPLHPDVKLKTRQVEELASRLQSLPVSTPTRAAAPGMSAERVRAQQELELAQSELDRISNESERLQKEIERLSSRLELTPRVELQLNELTSGLDVLKDQADSFQKKATDAAASLAMEKASQGSQFRALDRAQVPSQAVSPNRPLLVLMGGAVGLALGALLIIGLDLLFRPFFDDRDLARFTGVQVLVSIPHVGPFPSEWQRFRSQCSNLWSYLIDSLSFKRDEDDDEGPAVTGHGAVSSGPLTGLSLGPAPALAGAAAASPAPRWTPERPAMPGPGLSMPNVTLQHPAPMPVAAPAWTAPARPSSVELQASSRAPTPAPSSMPPVYTPRSPLPSGQGGAGQENRAARRDLAGQQYTNDFSDLLQGLQAHSRALDGAAGAEAVRSGGSVRAPWEGLGTPSRPSWEQAASARSPSNPAQLHAGGGAGLDQGWGDPAAHLVTYQPTQRPRGIDETMKELYRRAPWNNQTREGKDG